MDRSDDLIRFYGLIERLREKSGGPRTLGDCSGRMSWPRRGVYFFFENGEMRSETGTGPRVVRVGTHALKEKPNTKLWTRLRQHRGEGKSGRRQSSRLDLPADRLRFDKIDASRGCEPGGISYASHDA